MPRPKGAKSKQEAEQPAQQQEPDQDPAADPTQADGAAPAGTKKKRNNNPGVRVLGGRVYDSENGTTCHQCRQKTAELKAKCKSCTLYFCPKCLENRYQEKVDEANAQPNWSCPRCRGDCNCSNCRKKAGKEATGQLANIAKKAGFGSVKDLLVKNPNAKAIQLPKAPPSAAAAAGGDGGSEGSEEAAAAAAAGRKRAPAKRKAAAAEEELVADEELPPREQAMPEPRPLAVHKTVAGAPAGSKRQRGMAWASGLPEETALPEGRAGAELAVVLEFLQVFGPKLQPLRAPSLAALAAELLQPHEPVAAAAAAGQPPPPLLCPAGEESAVAAVHCRLLELVRAYWNVKGGVGAASWQGIMRGYYAASLLSQRQALDLRWEHGPPAVAGEIFTRPSSSQQQEQEQEAEEGGEGSIEEEGQEGDEQQRLAEEAAEPAAQLGAGGAAAAATVDYPAGGYWALPAAVRVGMLHALVHDALDCQELREYIEGSMGDALDEEKERRQQLAGVRKEAREAIARERDQQIALMIASASSGSLTLEQQQQMLEEARQRAEAAAATAAAAKVKALTEKVHPPTVRAAVVGSDRDGRRYLQLQAAPALTGNGGIIVQCCGPEGPSGGFISGGSDSDSDAGSADAAADAAEWLGAYASSSLPDVVAALHPQGRREGPLRAALVHAFKLPAPAGPAPVAGPAAAAAAAADKAAGSRGSSEERQQEGAQPPPAAAVPEAAVAGDAEVPAPSKQAAARKRKQVANKAAAAAPAAAAAAGSSKPGGRKAAASKRGGKSSSTGDGSNETAAAEPAAAAAAPAAGTKRRGRSNAAGAADRVTAKRQKKAESPAAPVPAAATAGDGKSSSRRTSPRTSSGSGSKPAGKAAVKPAAVAAGGRGRKAAGGRLPLKVDDMMAA